MRPRCRTVGPPGASAARPLPASSTPARRPSRLSITCDIQPFLQSQPGSPSTRPASAASDRISHGHLQESNVIPTRPQPPQPASHHEQDAATRAHPTPPFGRPSRPSPCIPEGAACCQGAGFGSSDDLTVGRLTRLPCIPSPRCWGMEPFDVRRRAQSRARHRRVGAIAEVERACS